MILPYISLEDKAILEDQQDAIDAVKMINDDLIKKVYKKQVPFSFIDDTGLSLYGFAVKNKYEVSRYDYERDCFICVNICGITNKRRTENISEDSLIMMIKPSRYNKREDPKKLDFMKIMGAC
tara:strand:- start:42 stop:410 length:369 start_codon:yes stop_codon:yes gene_type:complete